MVVSALPIADKNDTRDCDHADICAITQALIRSVGKDSLTSGDFKAVVLSPAGAGLAIISLLLFCLIIATDVMAFVIAEVARLRGNPIRTGRALLVSTMKALPRFWHPGTLVLLAYIGLIVPLVGFGPAVEQLSWLKIPNFVQDVINNNGLYYTLYVLLIIILSIVSAFLSQTIQSMYVDDVNPWRAMGKSIRFVRAHWLPTVLLLLRVLAVLVVLTLGTILVLTVVPWLITLLFPANPDALRFSVVFSAVTIAGSLGLAFTLVVPLQLRNFTRAYGVLSGAAPLTEEVAAELKREDAAARRPLFVVGSLVMCALIGLSVVSTVLFDEIFTKGEPKSVIAHRGGGDLDAENSLEGIEAAIERGVEWTEIDIQRTKDGHYVLNHDATFKRVAGVDSAAPDMTLAEIEQLRIENAFAEGAPSRPVATLEQLMDVAAGRIGLFIELKGSTADYAMVDDVAEMIKQRGLEDAAAMLSLDFELIRYAEEKYPELLTGYLYYFALGDSTTLPADYLIMEEGVATAETVASLQQAGKRVIVWTVNTPESIDRFVASNVDGIITDKPDAVIKALSEYAVRPDLDRVFDLVFGEG